MPWSRLKSVSRSIGALLYSITYWSCYKKPLRVGRRYSLQHYHLQTIYFYFRICLFINFGVPLYLLFLWYLLVLHGCQYTATRKLVLQEIYEIPFHIPGSKVPWHLDLWYNLYSLRDNHLSIEIPAYLKTVMIGHLELRDTILDLKHQAVESEQLALEFATPEILSSISMSNMAKFPNLISMT